MNGQPPGDSPDSRGRSPQSGDDRYRELQDLVDRYEAGGLTDREFRKRKRRILRGPLPEAERVELLVATYQTESEADAALIELRKLQQGGVLLIIDSTLVVRTAAGDIRTVEGSAGEPAGISIAEGLADLIFSPMFDTSGTSQEAVDLALREWIEGGFSREVLTSVGARLKPGESAVLAVVYNLREDHIAKELEGFSSFSRHHLSQATFRVLTASDVETPDQG